MPPPDDAGQPRVKPVDKNTGQHRWQSIPMNLNSATARSGFDIMNFVGTKIQATEAPAPPRELGALARATRRRAGRGCDFARGSDRLGAARRIPRRGGDRGGDLCRLCLPLLRGVEPRLFGSHPADLRRRDLRLPGLRDLFHRRVPVPHPSADPARSDVDAGVSGGLRDLLLRQVRRRLFPDLGGQLVQRRACEPADRPAGADRDGTPVGARRPPGPPGRHRRRRTGGQIPRACARERSGFRRAHLRRVRRSRRRTLAAGGRRHPQARNRRGSRPVHPPHPGRSRARVAAADGRGTGAADGAQAVGAAGGCPARRPYEPPAIPPPRLFLYRQRPGARYFRQADRRLEHVDEDAVRPRGRTDDPHPALRR